MPPTIIAFKQSPDRGRGLAFAVLLLVCALSSKIASADASTFPPGTLTQVQALKQRIVLYSLLTQSNGKYYPQPEIQYLILGPDGCKLRDIRTDGGPITALDYVCHVLPGSDPAGGSFDLDVVLPDGTRKLHLVRQIYPGTQTPIALAYAASPASKVLSFPDKYWVAIDPLPNVEVESSGPPAVHISVKGLDCNMTIAGQGTPCAVSVWDIAGQFIDVMASGDLMKQPTLGVNIKLGRIGDSWAMDPPSFRPFTPVMIAVMRKDQGALDKLIAQGADLNAHAPDQEAPILVALIHGSLAIATDLVSHGADLQRPTLSGSTVLLNAILRDEEADNLNLVPLMLAHGADVNQTDRDLITPLMAAIERNQANLAALLVEKGADVNHFDRVKDTALSRAVNFGQLATVKLLIAKGADPNPVDGYGMTPLDIAETHHNKAMTDLLLTKGALNNPQGPCVRAPSLCQH